MSSAMDKQRKVLGKGLSALLPGRAASSPAPTAPDEKSLNPARLPLSSIHANPMQPRTVFQADRLEELAASIRANGVIQPIVVRQHEGAYQIVAGERRWRAAKLAGVEEVPVVVQD